MNKIALLFIGVPLTCFTLNATAAATWIENRYAHTTSVQKNQYKLGAGHIFDNGAGLLAATFYDLGSDFDQMKSTFQEFEGWYPIKFDDKWSVTVGGLTDIDSNGVKLAPYASLNYVINKTVNVSARYRFNKMMHKEKDLNGDMDYNDSHQYDLYLNWQATDKLWLQFNPEYIVNINEFNAANGEKGHWEPAVVARYRMNKNWMPFAEVAWLDEDQFGHDQVRYRLGIRYYID